MSETYAVDPEAEAFIKAVNDLSRPDPLWPQFVALAMLGFVVGMFALTTYSVLSAAL